MATPYSAARCIECGGDGQVEKPEPLEVQYGGPYEVEYIDCPHCCGEGECECRDCVDTASENAFSDMCESEPPLSIDERHQMAWREKQELRR